MAMRGTKPELVTVFLIGVVLLGAGFLVGLCVTDAGPILAKVKDFQTLCSAFVALIAAMTTWMVARTNLAAADTTRREDRDHVSNSIKAEFVIRLRAVVQAFATLRYRQYHSPETEYIIDLDAFRDEGVPCKAACDGFLKRAWPLIEKTRASDRESLIETLDTLERATGALSSTLAQAGDAMTKTSDALRGEVHAMRQNLDTSIYVIQENVDVTMKDQVKRWIRTIEKEVAEIDANFHAVQPQTTKPAPVTSEV